MKFLTSAGFVLSGLQLYLIGVRSGPWLTAFVTVGISTVCSLMIFSALTSETFLDALGQIADGSEKTVKPGVPSIGSIVCFLLSSSSALAWHAKRFGFTRWCGLFLLVISSAALVGYALDVPALYWWIPGVSTGMAFLAAIFFWLLGVGHWMEGRAR